MYCKYLTFACQEHKHRLYKSVRYYIARLGTRSIGPNGQQVPCNKGAHPLLYTGESGAVSFASEHPQISVTGATMSTRRWLAGAAL